MAMGRPAIDYTGLKFHRLTGVRNTGEKLGKGFIWEWLCDCGNLHKALGTHVARGETKSCGCFRDNPNGLRAGDRFGLLTLIERTGVGKHGGALWRWKCDCGTVIDRPFQPIKEGRQVSCGCHRDEASRQRAKHGQWQSRTYHAWIAMKARCLGDHHLKHYKLRGITIDPKWVYSFEAFFADMGECPPKLTLERMDNSLGYSAGNCRWATQAVQTRNTRRTVRVTVDGVELCLKDACARKGVPYDRIRSRIRSGRDPQVAIDAP